jgi:hypothetical protein
MTELDLTQGVPCVAMWKLSRFQYPTCIFTLPKLVKNCSLREIQAVLHFGEGQVGKLLEDAAEIGIGEPCVLSVKLMAPPEALAVTSSDELPLIAAASALAMEEVVLPLP